MRRRPAHTTQNSGNFRWVGLCVVIVLLFLVSITLYRQFSQSRLSSIWRTTIVIESDPMLLVSISPFETDDILVFSFPHEALVSVPFGYGEYRLEALSRLSELEKKPELIEETLTDLMGVRVNEHIRSDSTTFLDADSLISDVRSLFQSTNIFFLSTDYNFVDRMKLMFTVWFAKDDRFRIYNFAQNQQVFSEVTLADATKSIRFSEVELDKVLGEVFVDSTIRKQGVTTVVYNATSASGVAAKFGRFLTRIGGDILRIDNTEKVVENCDIHTTSAHVQSQIVRYLKEAFSCTVTEVAEVSGAHMEVFVGETFAKRWRVVD